MKGIIVLLLLVTVIKCQAMSKHEIEEFSNFLRRASTLDQNLKDGSHAFDEDEQASDHAWEESGKFEGDLILNERQRRLIVEDVAEGLSRNGLKDSTKRWPDNEVIYYIQREHFSSDQVQAIQDGIDDLSRASCVKFRPYKKGDRDAVVIQGSRRGCFSQVGYQGGYQVLNLSARHPVGRGCFRHGTVVHEMLHTLGFYHMQSSPDRDDYIEVKWENIVEPAKHNFRKYNLFSVSDFGVGYDYDSVLHYSRRAFSSNGKPTLVPKQDGARIGQRIGLSDKDTQKLNKMYCDADSNNFEQADNVEPKVVKKKGKNLPFQGVGIGYHQGKTVVIKLPAAETYKLDESTSYPAFDYFNQAPQAVSSTLVQGSGIGKEVAFRPFLANDLKKYEYDSLYKAFKKQPEYVFKFNNSADNDFKLSLSKSITNQNTTEKSKSLEKDNERASWSKEPIKNNKTKFELDATADYDLEDAFDRLQNLKKSHVPQSTFVPFKLKDYSEYYITDKNNASKPHINKNYDFTHGPILKTANQIEGKGHVDIKNNDEEFEVESVTPAYQYSKYYGEVDSSYGTSFPFKKLYENEPSKKYYKPTDLKKLNVLANKYYFEGPSNSKRKDELSSLPLSEPWYNIDELKPNLQYSSGYANKGYGKLLPYIEKQDVTKKPLADFGYYTDAKSLEYLAKKQDYSSLYKPTQRNHEEDTTPYTLFRKSVPLTNEWYRTNKVGVPLENKSHNRSESASDLKKTKLLSKKTKEIDRIENYDIKYQSGSNEDEDSSSRSLEESQNFNKDDMGNIIRSKEENYDYSSELSANQPIKHKPTSIIKTAYDITEKSDENEDEKQKHKSEFKKENYSAASDESSSINGDMDDRLRDIISNYKEYDDFDISSSPYTSPEESTEE